MDGQTRADSIALVHPRWESYSPIAARSQLPPTAQRDITNVPEMLFCQFPIPTAHQNAPPGPRCTLDPDLSSWMGCSAPTTQRQRASHPDPARGTTALISPPAEEGQGLCSPSPGGKKHGDCCDGAIWPGKRSARQGKTSAETGDMQLCQVGYKETNCQPMWRLVHPNPLEIQ